MGFPAKALVDDERILLHTRPHATRMIVPVLVLFAACAGAGVALGLLSRAKLDGALPDWLLLAIVVVWVLVVGWWTARPWAVWRATHLVVTDLRIMFRSGIVRRRGSPRGLALAGHRRRRLIGEHHDVLLLWAVRFGIDSIG